MTATSIERLPEGAAQDALREHIACGVPFISRDIFPAEALAAYAGHDAAVRTLAEGTELGTKLGKIRLADYFAGDVTARFSVIVDLPPAHVARVLDGFDGERFGLLAPRLVAWMGRAGCLQRFHVDMDCRHNFLHQAFGAKRVHLVSPAHTQKLEPCLDQGLLLSDVRTQWWDEPARLAFLDYAGGMHGVVEEGETLYIPPAWWHFVAYTTDSLSFTIRSIHDELLDELSVGFQHMWPREWPLWHGIVGRLASDRQLAAQHAPAAREVIRFAREDRDPNAVLRALHDELCPGRYARPWRASDEPVFDPWPRRAPRRKQGTWAADDIPALRPYLELGARHGSRPALLVIEDRQVIAERAVDPEVLDVLAAIAAELDARPGRSVATLATELGLEVDDVCAVLGSLSAEGWVR